MLKERLAKLLGVRSLVTILLTLGLLGMIFIPGIQPESEILALYCTTYGAVISFFFSEVKKDNAVQKEEEDGNK